MRFCLRQPNRGQSGGIFNVGGDAVVNLEELAALLVQANEGKGEFTVREFPGDRKRIDIGDYYADDGLIRKMLGWKPQVPQLEGLRRSLEFYRENLADYQ